MQLLVGRPPSAPTASPEPATGSRGGTGLERWRSRRRLRNQLMLLRETPLFDAEWYRATYPEAASDYPDPALHYLLHGAAEGYDPGPEFSTAGYYAANPDVAEAGLNPLAHYVMNGRAEGRSLRPGSGTARPPAPAWGLRDRAHRVARTLRRNLLRPRFRFWPVVNDAACEEVPLRGEQEDLPSGWCVVLRPAAEHRVDHILRVLQDGPTLELRLGSSGRTRLTRLPDAPTRLALRVERRGAGPAERAAWPHHLDIRLVGRAEAAVRLCLAMLARPRALAAAIRRGRAWALLRDTARAHLPHTPSDYQTWTRLYDTPTPGQLSAMRARARVLREPPRFSVVVPTFNTAPEPLRQMLFSVRAQCYPHWELCVADDASTRPSVGAILRQAAAEDSRIRLKFRERNGNICAASNTALAMAGGNFVALLDHDDVLPPHALLTMAEAINANPRADLLYSDEDKLDADGRRYDPYFKPDFNEELLRAQNFLSHLGVYRATMLRDIGGFREGFEGSQDYDLALRVTARTRAPVVHVPHILYHWRLYPGAGTFSSTQIARATQAARQAIAEQAEYLGEAGTVVDGVAHYHRFLREPPGRWPSVTAIVPTRDHVDVLRECMDGLRGATDYPDLDVIVVDNGSVESRTHEYLSDLAARGVRVLPYPGAFNYSAINNFAARAATAEMLLLLNSDVSMLDPNWLREMVQQARGPCVGAVGARLLYPDLTVQHAGVVLGLGGAAGHVHLGAARNDPGYFGHLMVPREASAVTAACMLVPREIFWSVGGLDERNLPVAFNDVDFCLRLRQAGWRVVWTPFAELVHHESKSRGSDFTPERIDKFHAEVDYMRRRWGDLLQHDPFYNPNLSLAHPRPTPAFPPRIPRPWDTDEPASPGRRLAASDAVAD